jgi:hypothetical protein
MINTITSPEKDLISNAEARASKLSHRKILAVKPS